jgi:glycosyltransferase involved in cell wall biosynthesis
MKDKNNDIKISIITPTRNSEQFIEKCILNFISQECSQAEHIIVDGLSTDSTVEIIKKYAGEHTHIRWISEKDNSLSEALNKGIALAKGSIMSILNCDDFYEPRVLNRVLEIFKNLPEPSFIAGNCSVWDTKGKRYVNRPSILDITYHLCEPPAGKFPHNPSAYFYHTSLHDKIGLYDVNESTAMDLDFLFRAFQSANTFYFPEAWGNMLRHDNSITEREFKSGRNEITSKRIRRKYYDQLPIRLKLVTNIRGIRARIRKKHRALVAKVRQVIAPS